MASIKNALSMVALNIDGNYNHMVTMRNSPSWPGMLAISNISGAGGYMPYSSTDIINMSKYGHVDYTRIDIFPVVSKSVIYVLKDKK